VFRAISGGQTGPRNQSAAPNVPKKSLRSSNLQIGVPSMASSINEYKAKALECLRKAHTTPGDTRRELINLALAYVQLVELADMNAAVHKALQPVDGRLVFSCRDRNRQNDNCWFFILASRQQDWSSDSRVAIERQMRVRS
jgi:hypothetical protein